MSKLPVLSAIKLVKALSKLGYQIFHNYIRPHMGLKGATPADKAGIKVEGDNKWITLIQNATKPRS